jgi:LysR family transcriptional regulator, glycine cleavage system transcriptional activator
MKNLSNINALRAFETSARKGSYVEAARELNVTPAAIGQQVRALEAWLGVALFIRTNQGGQRLRPTLQARQALGELHEGFIRLSQGLALLREPKAQNILTVTASSAFVAKWLLERLDRFSQSNPNIDLRLDVSDRLVEFDRDGVNLGIRYGEGHWPGLGSVLLLRETVFAVCAPSYLSGHTPLNEPKDIESHGLIHDTTARVTGEGFPTWQEWCLKQGIDSPLAEHGLRINASIAVLQAAKMGRGLALARSVLVAEDLKSGALVRPFAHDDLPLKSAWYLVYPPQMEDLAKVRAFKGWILAEAKNF